MILVRVCTLITALLFFLALPAPAGAVKFMSIGSAVKTFVPSGAKIVKVSKAVTADHKKTLASDYGWTPTEPKYTFYVGKEGDARVAYVMIVPELFASCFHKYAVGMKADGVIIDTVIVELSCPRALPINTKSFMAQFGGKTYQDPLTTKVDIDGVTGATLSAESAAIASRKAVSLHNLFFGGAKAVKLSDEVKAGRAAGISTIDKAVKSGELIDKKKK